MDDPFQLEPLIGWLEKQPADKEYCFTDRGTCLLTQYYAASGYIADVGGFTVTIDGNVHHMSDDFGDIPATDPHTFGAALNRARELSASAEHAGDSK